MENILTQIKRIVLRHLRPHPNELSKKLMKYLGFRNGFFIEVGANNGYSQSNTFFLEKRLGWHGICIEAIPSLYEECKRCRGKSSVYNCALVAADYCHPTIKIHYAGMMSAVSGALKTETDLLTHIEAGLDSQGLENSYQIDIPARTLESILDETSDLPQIDFFSLDVEGYELNVLKGLNLVKNRPRLILVEARFLDEVNDYLIKNDYEMLETMSHHDYIYRTKINVR